MAANPIGVTLVTPDGQSAIGVYESPSGLEVFESDGPYLLSDGVSLAAPVPVFDAGGPTFRGSAGSLQASIAIRSGAPSSGFMWDQETPWDNGTLWS